MKKEWFSTIELTGIGGLPSTIQGINQKAKREEWISRKRMGVQGKAIEYHIDSLPEDIRNILEFKENKKHYMSNNDEALSIWLAAYKQLTKKEREQMITFIIRYGMSGIISILDSHQDQDE